MIRLALLDDNQVYLEALKLYLGKIAGIQLVYSSSDLLFMPVLIAAMPDVVIMDISLGTVSGRNAVRQIKEALPNTGIIMLTLFEDEEKIVQSIQAGASGFLSKKDSPKKIVEAIYHIYKREAAVPVPDSKPQISAAFRTLKKL